MVWDWFWLLSLVLGFRFWHTDLELLLVVCSCTYRTCSCMAGQTSLLSLQLTRLSPFPLLYVGTLWIDAAQIRDWSRLCGYNGGAVQVLFYYSVSFCYLWRLFATLHFCWTSGIIFVAFIVIVVVIHILFIYCYYCYYCYHCHYCWYHSCC